MSEQSPPGEETPERTPHEQRRLVRDRYARIASGTDGGSCCGDDAETGGDDGCCGTDADGEGGPPGDDGDAGTDDGCCGDGTTADQLGYTAEDVAAAVGADLSLGCGNPKAIAALSPGERVLDLGSGAGFDCFLAAREVGESGAVVGVDMTPEMVERARENARENDVGNVEFRLGEIEHLPVADRSVDVVISNCVVNLSPEKGQVFAEAFRALVPGGRLAISDVVLTAPLPASVRDDPASVAACVAGASPVDEIGAMLADAGFERVRVEPDDDSDEFISEWDDERDLSEHVRSATIEAVKPEEPAAD